MAENFARQSVIYRFYCPIFGKAWTGHCWKIGQFTCQVKRGVITIFAGKVYEVNIAGKMTSEICIFSEGFMNFSYFKRLKSSFSFCCKIQLCWNEYWQIFFSLKKSDSLRRTIIIIKMNQFMQMKGVKVRDYKVSDKYRFCRSYYVTFSKDLCVNNTWRV